MDKLIWMIGLSFFLNVAQAEQPLKIGVAQFPPFAYQTSSGEYKGLEVDIIRACFDDSPFQYEFVQYPYGRLPIAFEAGDIDIRIVAIQTRVDADTFYSDIVALIYQSVAISLREKKLHIKSISDLAGKSVVAHQLARTYYGDEFEAIATSKAKIYKEVANQLNQLRLLYQGRVDSIVIGLNIFHFFKRKAPFDTSAPIEIAKIFGERQGYRHVFKDIAVRDYFNRCLSLLKQTGQYRQLIVQNSMSAPLD